jgi:hypothetical protein
MKGKIMDFTDLDARAVISEGDGDNSFAPKVTINYTHYDTETNKAKAKHRHFVDLDVLRLLAFDLLTVKKGEKGEKGYSPILDEFKGGSAEKAGISDLGPNGVVSRRLTVRYNDALNMGPVFVFSFTMAEGKKGDKGQIMPVKDGKVFLNENINVPVAAARKLGAELQQYLQAKSAAEMVLLALAPYFRKAENGKQVMT